MGFWGATVNTTVIEEHGAETASSSYLRTLPLLPPTQGFAVKNSKHTQTLKEQHNKNQYTSQPDDTVFTCGPERRVYRRLYVCDLFLATTPLNSSALRGILLRNAPIGSALVLEYPLTPTPF